jgi:cytochrome P450 family 6
MNTNYNVILVLSEVTMNVIAAQAFVFFSAGFETSSTTMTFCLYELALNPDIQDRLRAEIDRVLQKNGGNITYESIFEMEYLEKVVDGRQIKQAVSRYIIQGVSKRALQL